jgi:hypothetical protein
MLNHMVSISCMGCKAYINDDLLEDPWCQSCINSYSDIKDKDTDNNYFTADEEEVWTLAFEKIYLPTSFTPTWDFPTFDHFVALSVRWSFFDSCHYMSVSMKYDEEYVKRMFDW